MGRDRPAPWGGPALQPALTVWVGMAPLSPGAPRGTAQQPGRPLSAWQAVQGAEPCQAVLGLDGSWWRLASLSPGLSFPRELVTASVSPRRGGGVWSGAGSQATASSCASGPG